MGTEGTSYLDYVRIADIVLICLAVVVCFLIAKGNGRSGWLFGLMALPFAPVFYVVATWIVTGIRENSMAFPSSLDWMDVIPPTAALLGAVLAVFVTVQLVQDKKKKPERDAALDAGSDKSDYSVYPANSLTAARQAIEQNGAPKEIVLQQSGDNEFLDAILVFADGRRSVFGGFATDDGPRCDFLKKLLDAAGAPMTEAEVRQIKTPFRHETAERQ